MAFTTSPAVINHAKALIDFINGSPSPYHVVDMCKNVLRKAGFIEISEKKQWSLQKGGKYFMTRNQSTVMAWVVGEKFEPGNGFSIIGAHTDSPCLKIKPVSKKNKSGFLSVGVQCYGGGIWGTWFDRDLTVAGRVIVQDGENIRQRLVHVQKAILRVPNICIHLQRDINDKFCINKETHTLPILATEVLNKKLKEAGEVEVEKEKKTESSKHHSALIKTLCENANCKPEDIIDMELVLADTQPAIIGGVYDEFIFAPRLDNLMSTFCALRALVESTDEGLTEERNVRMITLYDNEEVGSESAQGAASMLTEHVIRRICQSINSPFEKTIANSFLLSADQAHAVHPNYPEKHEENHKPAFHGGPVIKINANQRYATTAVTSSILKVIAKKCEVPIQEVVVKNDSQCGSTIGPILSAKLGIRTLDIGGPQLSMHSIREMCCTSSVYQNITLYKAFFKDLPIVDASFCLE